tara:strand:- start:1050 stop:1655 length:606 start_codon:yes stop_codon:yes gene_type:complete
MSIIPNSIYKVGTAATVAIAGGETEPIADPDNVDGWLFSKAMAGSAKFNYFFYGGAGTTEVLTLADMRSYWSVVRIDNYQAVNSLPFIVIYTKPTGIGDAGPWYHSKIRGHFNPDTHHIALGEQVQMYLGNEPSVDYGYRKIKCDRVLEGDGYANEEILYMTLHSDTGAPVGTQIFASDFGYETQTNFSKGQVVRKIKLIS